MSTAKPKPKPRSAGRSPLRSVRSARDVPVRDVPVRDELAARIDRVLSAARTSAVLSMRWWRPSWEDGYQAGLRRAHDDVAAELVAAGCVWPTAPSAPSAASVVAAASREPVSPARR